MPSLVSWTGGTRAAATDVAASPGASSSFRPSGGAPARPAAARASAADVFSDPSSAQTGPGYCPVADGGTAGSSSRAKPAGDAIASSAHTGPGYWPVAEGGSASAASLAAPPSKGRVSVGASAIDPAPGYGFSGQTVTRVRALRLEASGSH